MLTHPSIPTNPADNRYLYNGKEKQLTGGLGFLDYGARMSDPEIVRWHNPDQLAEASKSISPYAFTSNDPINKLDPDGNLDDWYFNIKGQFLGKDDKTTDNIRIMAQSTWNAISEKGSISGELGGANSVAFAQSPLSNEAMLNVFQYFNNTGVKLEAQNISTNRLMAAHPNHNGVSVNTRTNKVIRVRLKNVTIKINMTQHRKSNLLNNVYNIKNSFIHEVKHVNDLKADPVKYYNVTKTYKENRAIDAQKKHSSWSKTTPEFKTNVEEYWKVMNKLK